MTNRIPWGPEHPKFPNCPVAPGTDCTVWFSDDGEERDFAPEDWDWDHHNRTYDIIAYTDHSAPDDASAIRDQLGPKFKHLAEAVAEELRNHSAPDQARELLASIRDDVERAHDWEVRCGFPGLALEIEQRLAAIDAYLKGAD